MRFDGDPTPDEVRKAMIDRLEHQPPLQNAAALIEEVNGRNYQVSQFSPDHETTMRLWFNIAMKCWENLSDQQMIAARNTKQGSVTWGGFYG